MSRTSFLVLAVAFCLFSQTSECSAQVGFGAQQGLVNSGITLNTSPVVTNSRRYVRTGINVGFTQLVDVQTFSPVQGFSGLTPTNPIGFGFGGVNPGFNQGFSGPRGYNFSTSRPIPKPIAGRVVDAAWQFDKDKNARLNRAELEKLALAVAADLKRTHRAAYQKLKRGAQGTRKPGTLITEKDVSDAFVKQCLKYDRDKDNSLNPRETDVMAMALVRFLR